MRLNCSIIIALHQGAWMQPILGLSWMLNPPEPSHNPKMFSLFLPDNPRKVMANCTAPVGNAYPHFFLKSECVAAATVSHTLFTLQQ